MNRTAAALLTITATLAFGGVAHVATALPVMQECESVGAGSCELADLGLPDCGTPGLTYPQECEVSRDLPVEAEPTVRYLAVYIEGLYLDTSATIDRQASKIGRQRAKIERLRARIRALRD